MDERLLKRSVQSVEMPEDMKDRITANCKSGETKPLFLPKRRLAYIPTAVTACVCVLVAALAGIGVWQLKVLSDEMPALSAESDGTVDPQEDVIHVITLEQANLTGSNHDLDEKDMVQVSDEQLREYFGMDVSRLNSLTGIPADMHCQPYGWEANPYFYVNGGKEGDIFTDAYYDIWSAAYGNSDQCDYAPAGLRSITLILSMREMPLYNEKLWEDTEMLSFIGGRQVAIGCWTASEDEDVWFAQFTSEDGSIKICVYGYRIDFEELHTFVADVVEQTKKQSQHEQPAPTYEKLTLDKLREICSGDTSKLSWSDFEQYETEFIGSGLYIQLFTIEDKYTLSIGGVPGEDPYYMQFRKEGQYYAIDIREDSLEEYLNEPIHEGDIINITPLTEDEINYFMSADFAEEDRVYMTDEELSEYYGIDITAFGNIPSYMEAESYTKNDGMRCIWWRDDGTGLYYDKNTFTFINPDGSEVIEISLGRLINSIDKLWEVQKMRSRIGGRDVVIGKTDEGHYVAELRSGDGQIGILVNAYGGISLDELCDVITALVQQTEKRNYHYYGEYSEEDINFIYAEYTGAEDDKMWLSLNGLGYDEEKYPHLADEDYIAMSRDELNEYYGVNIFPDLPAEETQSFPNGVKGPGVYRLNGGTGEIYFDTNAFWYTGWTSNNIRIDVAKDGLPYMTDLIEKLMSDPANLSYVNGNPVLLMYGDYGCEFAIFMTASGKAGFRIAMADVGYGGANTADLTNIVSQLIDQ